MTNLTKYNFIKLEQYKEETMKLYHTETQEDYDALMVELEKEGCMWASGRKPTKENNWEDFREDTCVKCYGDELTYERYGYFKNQKIIEKYKAKQDEVAKWYGDAANIMKALSAGWVSVKNENTDNVNNPAYYTAGGIETLDYIKAKVKDYPSYAAGNILKYVSRFEHKNGIEDLKKAQFCLNDLINWMESD
ncbi:DUF3310 domain-containing protein [Listeria innocua]|uniref:DUF3310 domain-containing protein n=1 Tax=Listeria innocua TaxID=1642 RepID=UPI0035E3DFA4